MENTCLSNQCGRQNRRCIQFVKLVRLHQNFRRVTAKCYVTITTHVNGVEPLVSYSEAILQFDVV